MNNRHNEITVKWQHQMWIVASGFYLFAFISGAVQTLISPSVYQLTVSPLYLVTGLGLYTIARVFYPFHWYKGDIHRHTIIGTDIAICIFLVFLTGGLYSPFLTYTLVPIATAGLLLRGRVTLGIACLTTVYVIINHIWNPFLPTQLSIPELGRLLSYLVILSLVAVLPYLINVSLRQRWEFNGILLERQTLIHEIHDGVAQIASALRWQAQFVQRRLGAMNINLDEVQQLLRLIEKVHEDIRECLNSLHQGTEKLTPSPHLEVYQQNQNHYVDAETLLHSKIAEVHPIAIVEAQLLYICREAIANIRKHSGAHEIKIKIQSVDGQLKLTIADDGRGFDTLAFYHDGTWTESHGIEVMRERAESIGGKLKVISVPLTGTEIQVEIPIKNKVLSGLS